MITLLSNGHPLSEIGVKSLKGYLEHYNIPVRAIYLDQCGIPSDELTGQILDLTKDSLVVGFSLMSKDVVEFLPIIKAIREKQKIPVLAGGIHPTALPGESLDFADFVCVGEGEEPLRLLYNAISDKKNEFYDILNIGWHKDGEKIINQTTYFAESLDDLPFPDYEFKNCYLRKSDKIMRIPEDPEEKKKILDWEALIFYSQRGCRFACTYCSNSLYHKLAGGCGKKWYRVASPKRVIDELRHYYNILPFIKGVTINDDDFLARDIKDLEEISNFLKNELHLRFTINAIPTYVTEKKIAVLTRNGLRKIGFGVQSGSERILKEIYHRGQTNEIVLQAAKIVNKYGDQTFNGLYANYGFILDNPYETDDDWRDSLRLLISLPRPRTINLYSLTFFAGTELAKKAQADGYVSSLLSDYNKKYQDDIKYTYPNTLFFLNHAHLPLRLNNFLMSNFMVRSKIASPLRNIIKNRDLSLKILQFAINIKIYLVKTKKFISKLKIKKIFNRSKRLILDNYEKFINPLPYEKAATKEIGWSVVIITGSGSEETLKMTIESAAKELGATDSEIVIVGPPELNINNSHKIAIKKIDYKDIKLLPGLITRKKNIGVMSAKYDKVAVCHDYIIFEPGWKKGFDEFGNDFEVCVNKILNKDGTRYIDWAVWDYPEIGAGLLPYNVECTRYQYISGAYFAVKKDFYLANPLNDSLRWGEGEDIEWSKRIRKKTIFKFNPLSSVRFTKEKFNPGKDWGNNKRFEEIFKS